jgi:hypothetical protein
MGVKDVVLTGSGVAVIWVEALSSHPSGLLLGTGLALTVPSVADHVRALLPSSGGGESSPPPELPGPQPSQAWRGGAGNG